MLVAYLAGLGLRGVTLACENTGCAPAAGVHNPKLVFHLGHLSAGGGG